MVKSIRDENTFYLVLKKYKNSEETWDKIAWREIGRIVKGFSANYFPHLNIKESLYIEDEGIPKE